MSRVFLSSQRGKRSAPKVPRKQFTPIRHARRMVGHILRGPDMSLTPIALARNLNRGRTPALSQELVGNSSTLLEGHNGRHVVSSTQHHRPMTAWVTCSSTEPHNSRTRLELANDPRVSPGPRDNEVPPRRLEEALRQRRQRTAGVNDLQRPKGAFARTSECSSPPTRSHQGLGLRDTCSNPERGAKCANEKKRFSWLGGD